MRLLVGGSRDWDDYHRLVLAMALVVKEWGEAHPIYLRYSTKDRLVVVHGACKTGADDMASRVSATLGWPVEPHPALWSIYGNRAGPIRNSEMVGLGADVCLVFVKDDSPGASGLAQMTIRVGIKTLIYRNDNEPPEVYNTRRKIPRRRNEHGRH